MACTLFPAGDCALEIDSGCVAHDAFAAAAVVEGHFDSLTADFSTAWLLVVAAVATDGLETLGSFGTISHNKGALIIVNTQLEFFKALERERVPQLLTVNNSK